MDIALSPTGKVYLDKSTQDTEPHFSSKLEELFQNGPDKALLVVGIEDPEDKVPPGFAYWRSFARRFITEVCRRGTTDGKIPLPSADELETYISEAPFFKGSEYLHTDILKQVWHNLSQAFIDESKKYTDVNELFKAYNSSWNLVGRVYFHLAENKNDTNQPFAFLATYTTRLSAQQVPKHIPLGKALQEYAGEKNTAALLSLLTPVQKAAAKSSVIKQLIEGGQIYQPISWTAQQAYAFLKDIPLIESAGILTKIPQWWNSQKPPRPQVAVAIGDKQGSLVGLDSLVDFDIQLTLSSGQVLSPDDWHEILHVGNTLIKIKEQWVEVDQEKLHEVLDHWQKVQKLVKTRGLTFAEGMRMLAGPGLSASAEGSFQDDVREWSAVRAGAWLQDILEKMRHPENVDLQDSVLATHLQATLRPYQAQGVRWLWLLYSLQLGGCLADDMGLGKTIQVIGLLLLIKFTTQKKPHLLVVPASLLGNWQAELQKFAPTLVVRFVHPSAEAKNEKGDLEAYDLIVTTYGFVHRLPWLTEIAWDMILLDEAQVIKNPSTQQTRAVKALRSSVRFVLTGTPIENSLTDLWSLFDFCAPGLLIS